VGSNPTIATVAQFRELWNWIWRCSSDGRAT